MTVTAEIDVTRPTGRRIVRDLRQHSKVVKLDYSLPEGAAGKGYTLEESYNMVMDRMSKHYGIDVRNL